VSLMDAEHQSRVDGKAPGVVRMQATRVTAPKPAHSFNETETEEP
jgi:hypothetical protein